jgi:hypothetical protein
MGAKLILGNAKEGSDVDGIVYSGTSVEDEKI